MNETAVTTSDLDRLTERVEKAAALVQQLREDRTRLERERDDQSRLVHELEVRLQTLEHRLQGQDPSALVQEIASLKKEQREWIGERRDIASRVETLIKKLERLEG